MYIPDLTERYPEGFRCVSEERETGYEPTYEEWLADENAEGRCFMFEKGRVYITSDWFTGGTMKFHYEGKDELSRGVFTVEDFELDGNHIRTEPFDILEDDNGNEYITIGEYNGHLHCIHANEYR